MQYAVKEILEVKPFVLTLKFNTGEILEVNLEPQLKEWSSIPDSIYKQLLDKDYFCQVQYESDWETVYWENGVDFCADVLYEMALKNKPTQSKNEILEAIYLLYKTLDKEQRKTVIKKLEDDLVLTD